MPSAPAGGSATNTGAVAELQSLIAQTGAGTQEGIAQMAGFPVDAVTGGINAVGQMTGLYEPIQNPVGGSASIDAFMSPLRANVPEPATRGERVARRVGEEIGAGAVMAPAAMLSPAVRAAPGAFAATEAASTLGSGASAAAANEMFPGSATAEIVGSLLGGVPAGMAATRLTGTGTRPADVIRGIDDQRATARQLYGEVRADPRTLPLSSTQGMVGDIQARMADERLYPRLQPSSSAMLDVLIEEGANPMRIEDVENLRRLTTQSLPSNAADADRRLSTIMKDEITQYLEGLNDPVASTLTEARDAYRRGSAAGAVETATDRAALRAATSGTGGNEINAIRQNLRRILEQPRLSRSFTEQELGQIRQIVEGTPDQNVLRSLSRIAPSTGGLSAMLGVGGAMASPEAALPIMGAGELARYAGERSTRSSIARLLQSLAPDRTLAPSQPGIEGIISALLAARTASSDE